MKVHGTRTTTEYDVEVNIPTLDILKYLENEIWARAGRPVAADYINPEGIWEDWNGYGHGSGITTRHGEATIKQLEIDKALKLIKAVLT